MEAYIGEIREGSWRGIDSIEVLFAGYNYNYPGFYYKELKEFKEDFLIELREVKERIEELYGNNDIALFKGGEPTLQGPALIQLAKFTKSLGLSNILFTNATKPGIIKRLIRQRLIDIYVIEIPAPLDERFEKVTRSATFFKSSEMIINDIKESIEWLSKEKDIGIVFRTKVIPGLMYRKEDFLSIGRFINKINASWELIRFNPELSSHKLFKGINKPSKEFIEELISEILRSFPSMRIDWSD